MRTVTNVLRDIEHLVPPPFHPEPAVPLIVDPAPHITQPKDLAAEIMDLDFADGCGESERDERARGGGPPVMFLAM